jgi:hypothetical protein
VRHTFVEGTEQLNWGADARPAELPVIDKSNEPMSDHNLNRPSFFQPWC